MTLPSIETPRYELTLPSTDKVVQYRPFLVKEEKILLVAMESNDNKEILNAIREILSACTYDSVDVNTLPIFDIEYIFLQIRSKSVGEVSKVKLLCPDDKETYADVEIDLTKVNVQVDDAHTNNVVIDENRKLGIVFNYPTLEMTKAGFNVTDTDIDSLFDIMATSINHIYEGDKIYPSKDSTKEEMKKFLEGLPQTAFNKIKTFFETMPQLRHSVEVENPKTKVKSTIVLQGIRDFFQ
jgi:T4 bacteriophage base plate protein.